MSRSTWVISGVDGPGPPMSVANQYIGCASWSRQRHHRWVVASTAWLKVMDDASISRLASHLLLTAATRTLKADYLAGLDTFISTPHQSYCYDFITEWLHSEDSGELYRIARHVEDETRLYQRFAKLSADDLINTECFPCINKCILSQLMAEISDHRSEERV